MSGSTETGLNRSAFILPYFSHSSFLVLPSIVLSAHAHSSRSIDIKLLKLYQQICLYILPHITNLMFISPLIVALRLFWFHKHMDSYGMPILLSLSWPMTWLTPGCWRIKVN